MDPRKVVQAFDNPNFRDSDSFVMFVETYKREALRRGISPKQDKVLVLLLALQREGIKTVGEARARIRALAAKKI